MVTAGEVARTSASWQGGPGGRTEELGDTALTG